MEASFLSEITPLLGQGPGFGDSQMLATFVRDGLIGWLEIVSLVWVMFAAIGIIVHFSMRERDQQSTIRKLG